MEMGDADRGSHTFGCDPAALPADSYERPLPGNNLLPVTGGPDMVASLPATEFHRGQGGEVGQVNEQIAVSDGGIENTKTWMATARTVHYIGNTVVHGDHPDKRVNEAVASYIDREGISRGHFLDVVHRVPNLNNEYGEELGTVREQLAADFGEGMRDHPIFIVPEEAYDDLRRRVGQDMTESSNGMLVFGHMLIRCRDQGQGREFTSRGILRTGLHEGAHVAAGMQDNIIISADYSPGHNDNPAQGFIERETVGGLIELGDPDSPHITTGHFWEEALVDEYSVRRTTALGKYPRGVEGRTAYPGSGGGPYVCYGEAKTHYDRQNDRLFIPWGYTNKAQRSPETGLQMNTTSCASGAYGLHLLDREVPGLFNEMLSTRFDPAARDRAKEMVNSLRDGLYEELAELEYSLEGFASGLLTIVKGLGLANKPVEPLRLP